MRPRRPGRTRSILITFLIGIMLPLLAPGGSLAAQTAPSGSLAAQTAPGGSLTAQAVPGGTAQPTPSWLSAKIAADGSDAGSFGVAVDLSADGSTAIVGATQHNFNRGGAYIFQRVNGVWSRTADLT